MPITNLEREIRFSNFTLEEYSVLSDNYKKQLLSLMEHDNGFLAILESKGTYIKPKKSLQNEAEELSHNEVEPIANFGKSVLKFLVTGVKGFDDLCIAISVVLMTGGVVLFTCITLVIGIILYAVTIIPFATLIAGLAKIDKTLGSYIHTSDDKNVKKYAKLSENIQKQVGGVKDIKDLEKLINISEALNDIIEYPNQSMVVEAHQLVSVINSISERVSIMETSKFDILSMRMDNISDLAPKNLTHNFNTNGIMESTTFGEDATDVFMTLESIVSKPMLSNEGLLQGIIAITTEACSEKSIGKFFNSYKETVKYELLHESFLDLPIIAASNYSIEYVKERCGDVPEIMESCEIMDSALGEIIDSCIEEVKEDGFNPNQLDLGGLTPLPVASRKVGDLICDICDADTDEELTEAMLSLGRVNNIIQEIYYVTIHEDGSEMIIESDAGKAARMASNKAERAFAKSATKDKTGGVGQAVKRTVDPMEKFIQKQYKILKEKDANERRKVILTGGTVPKVLRWIKRGVGLLAGAAVGQVIPAAAIITGITFIGYIATDKYLDRKERAKIMRELEDEIMICNEKIDDSRGDDNKQKKYELMRIRNNLQRTRDKIHYGLKD